MRKSRPKKSRSLAEDIAGARTGTTGGMTPAQYAQKYPSNVTGFMKTLTSPMEDHIVDRKGIRTHSSGGRNNPRGARGAR